MDNTMRITIPWKPGMAVMLKDGRHVPDGVIDYLAEQGVSLERIAAVRGRTASSTSAGSTTRTTG